MRLIPPYRPTMWAVTVAVPAFFLLALATNNQAYLVGLAVSMFVGTVVAVDESIRRFKIEQAAKDDKAVRCPTCGTVLLKPAPFVMMSRCTMCGTLHDIVPR